jgi:hypothetical protein
MTHLDHHHPQRKKTPFKKVTCQKKTVNFPKKSLNLKLKRVAKGAVCTICFQQHWRHLALGAQRGDGPGVWERNWQFELHSCATVTRLTAGAYADNSGIWDAHTVYAASPDFALFKAFLSLLLHKTLKFVMNRFVFCTLAIVCSACVVVSVPLHDIATLKAAGFNVTRNLQGKKEAMVRNTIASSRFQGLTPHSNSIRWSMPTPLGIAMAITLRAPVASKYLYQFMWISVTTSGLALQ